MAATVNYHRLLQVVFAVIFGIFSLAGTAIMAYLLYLGNKAAPACLLLVLPYAALTALSIKLAKEG